LMPDHVHVDLDPTEVRGVAGGRFHQGQERDPSRPFTGKGSATSWDNTSGPGVTSSTRSVGTRRRYARTSATKRRKIRGRINLTSGGDPPLGGTNLWGRVSDPSTALGGSSSKAPGFAGGYLPLALPVIGTLFLLGSAIRGD
jgi:hypothetical protein